MPPTYVLEQRLVPWLQRQRGITRARGHSSLIPKTYVQMYRMAMHVPRLQLQKRVSKTNAT